MKSRNIIFILLLLLFPAANAQEGFTLEQCREMALENNKQIGVASYTKKQAEQNVKSYRSNFLPRFYAAGGYLYTTNSLKETLQLTDYMPPALGGLLGDLPGIPLELKFANTWTANVRAEQPLYMGGKITSAYKMSRIGDEIAGLNQHLTEAEVLVQADEAYWTHVKTNELTKSARKYKEVVSELYRVVQNAYNSGMKSQNDVLKVQVKLNEAELQLRQAENGVRLSRMNLCHIIGLPLNSDIILSETLDDATIEVSYTTDITSRPEYSILSKQIELKDQQTKLVRSDFLPNVGVMANYGYTQGLRLNNDRLLDNDGFSAMVSVNIPIYHWGEGKNKIRTAKHEKEIAQLQFEEMSDKMQLELMQALNAYDESILEVQLTTHSLEQAEENLKVSKNQYEAGMETLVNYLEAQTVWQKASSDMINAKASMKCAETSYLKAAGKL